MTKKEQILEAAENLFSEHGYEGTSVRALAGRAKVNIAMISYYFGSKEKLFEALVEYRAGILGEKLKIVRQDVDDPALRLDRVVDLIVDRIFSNPRFHRMLHREISLQQRSAMNNHIINILMKNMDQVRNMIQDGIKMKVFRNVDVDMLICSMFSTTSQVAHSSVFTARLLGMRTGKSEAEDQKIKTRLKNYMKDLLRQSLLRNKQRLNK